MKVLRHKAQIAPATFFATLLNAPCSSMLLANANSTSTVYLIIGKSNGETIFFPTDRSECVSKFECEVQVPITALAVGDLRNVGKKEIVTITANGLLQSLAFPNEELARVFCQQIYANVCSAQILDIDGDNLMELVVVMTDRVVRTYRSLRKLSDSFPSTNGKCLYKSMDGLLGWENLPSVMLCCPSPVKTIHPTGVWRYKRCQSVLSSNLHSVALLHSLVEKLIVVNSECNTETQLKNIGGDIVCITTLQLNSGLTVLVTVDTWGQLFIYGWSGNMITTTEPLARCQVLREVDYMCGFAGAQAYSFIIGVVNIYNKISLFSIDLTHIVEV
uniref:Uncharacterized protein n=1 Tax=Ditylenchus dipsaci TaxID=166011 RepID=A0A915E4C9_9BILA